ncbi:PIN domain-containing protein [Patescibacteria group bacterium]|nr:PIN domain-containing protein [Patescibacteria group bacterium]
MNGSKKYFLDANIFLRVFIREHVPSFLDCSKILQLIQDGKISAVINTLVFAEVGWVLGRLYKFSKHEVIMALNSMAQLKNLSIYDRHDVLLGLSLYGQYNVKFIDAMIAANDVISIWKAPIISYDKDFDKLGVKRVVPSDLL